MNVRVASAAQNMKPGELREIALTKRESVDNEQPKEIGAGNGTTTRCTSLMMSRDHEIIMLLWATLPRDRSATIAKNTIFHLVQLQKYRIKLICVSRITDLPFRRRITGHRTNKRRESSSLRIIISRCL